MNAWKWPWWRVQSGTAPRASCDIVADMNIVVLLIILLLLFGGGGFYLGGPAVGGGLGGIILLVLIVLLLTGSRLGRPGPNRPGHPT